MEENVKENMPEVVKLLLEKCPDININARQDDRRITLIGPESTQSYKIRTLTALETALSYGNDECALLLLENHAQWGVEAYFQPDPVNELGDPIKIPNLAFAAAYHNCPKALTYFVEHYINLDAKLDKWNRDNTIKKDFSLQEFVKLRGSTEASEVLHRHELRKRSIEPRKRIKAALRTFNKLIKENTIPKVSKNVIRKILSYLIDDVIAGSAYTKKLVPDYEYLKETIIKRFTSTKKTTSRIPRVSKERLGKALGLDDLEEFKLKAPRPRIISG